MKIDTPLHTDHQLDQLAGQFEEWRQARRTSPRTHSRAPVGASRGVGLDPVARTRGQAVTLARQ